MAEVLGLVASVIQVAGAGLKLSQTLYQYADGVATADRRIKDIAREVQLTSLVIDELGNVFRRDETIRLISNSAVSTAEQTMRECSTVFAEIEATLAKSKKGRMGKWTLPFRDSRIELLRSHMEKLKSTLQLLMQVLLHAFQVSSNQLDREAEARQREELRELLELQKQATQRYEDSLRDFSISDGSTMVDDEQSEDKDMDDMSTTNISLVAVSAVESTITPDTLADCMQHTQSLLQDMQSLKQVLEQNIQGADHSNHHQTLLGSYLQTRAHLDKVLLAPSSPHCKITTVVKSSPRTWPSQTRITTPRASPNLLTSAHPRFPESPGPAISLEGSSEVHVGVRGYRSDQEYQVQCFDRGDLVLDEGVGVGCGAAVGGGGEEVVEVDEVDEVDEGEEEVGEVGEVDEGEKEEVDELVRLWTNIGV